MMGADSNRMLPILPLTIPLAAETWPELDLSLSLSHGLTIDP